MEDEMRTFLNNSKGAVNVTEEMIGGLPYILKFLNSYVPYTVFTFLGVLFGISGNLLIFGAVFSSKELRNNPTCILILNLAIADFSISFLTDSFSIVGVLAGKRFFDERSALCHFVGATCLVACGNSLVTMGFLAFNRYLSIIHNSLYHRFFTLNKAIAYSCLTWLISILLDLPNFFGVGNHIYDTKTLSCVFDRLKVGYTMSFSVCCILIPCILIAVCYLKIFWFSYKIKNKIKDKSSKKSNKEAIKIAKSLFASFALFACCWIPVAIIFIVDMEDKLPIPAHVFTNLPAHLNSSMNPIFYGIFNPKMREGYKKFLNMILPFKYFKEPSETSNSIRTIEMTHTKINANPNK